MSDRSQLNGPLGNTEGGQFSGKGDYQTQKVTQNRLYKHALAF